jgi:flagellar biosynthesis chaperone FliJ
MYRTISYPQNRCHECKIKYHEDLSSQSTDPLPFANKAKQARLSLQEEYVERLETAITQQESELRTLRQQLENAEVRVVDQGGNQDE